MTAFAKVGGLTLISRLLGFLRDLILAHLFGADARTDAFFVAFKIPNFMRRLFVEGGFAAALVPTLTAFRQRGDGQAMRRFVDDVSGSLALVALLVTLLGMVCAPWLVLLFAPGFSGDMVRLGLTVDMVRLTLPYLLLISLTALAGAILNSHQRFAVAAMTPMVLNLIMIASALWLSPRLVEPVTALAWGVLVAGVVQLTLQLPFLHQLGLLPRPRIGFRDAAVRRVFATMGPVLLGVSITQINLLLDTLMASFLANGAISWLYYSDRLMEFPLGVLGAALAAVILPSLSEGHLKASREHFSHTLDWAVRWALFLGLPAAIGLALLAQPIISTLFASALFDGEDVAMAARSLSAYALGLPGFVLIKALAPGYYARHDSATPVRIGMQTLAVNLGLSLLLVYPFGHGGLALGTSLAAYYNAVMLYRGLRRVGCYQPLPGWGARLIRLTFAVTAMATLLLLAPLFLGDWADMERVVQMGVLLLLILGAGGIYFLSLWLLGMGKDEWLLK
jgi:putative peptidoglycan lipid II flippase